MNEQLAKIVSYLKDYDGPEIRLMEVCGTHTAAIFKGAIRSLISPKIHLISGPGCPVCVTTSAWSTPTWTATCSIRSAIC